MNDSPTLFDNTDDDTRGAFARYGPTFVAKGYAVTTVPDGAKWPPRTGTTGRYPQGGAPDDATAHESADGKRRDLTADEVRSLAAGPDSRSGLAIVLRPGQCVVDTDDYDGKGGAATLADYEARAGCRLPAAPSMRAENRPASSGRFFYRCPPNVVLRGQLGPGVEILQASHRYCVGPGTTHPTAGVVRCYDADGFEIAPDEFPTADELPALPDAFVALFTAGNSGQPALVDSDESPTTTPPTAKRARKRTPVADSTVDEVAEFMAAHGPDSVTVGPEVWRLHIAELPTRYGQFYDAPNDANGNNGTTHALLHRWACEVAAGLYPAEESYEAVVATYLHRAHGNRPAAKLRDEADDIRRRAIAYALHDTTGRAEVQLRKATADKFHDAALRRQRDRETEEQLERIGSGDESADDELSQRRKAKTADNTDSTVDDTTTPAATRLAPPQLDEEFWSRRAVLAHIAQAARSQRCSPDAVLAAVLARLAAMTPHTMQVQLHHDAGPVPLSYYSLIVGPKGVGKTKAMRTAARLLPRPPDASVDFADSVPLGSGEGIVESYYGTVPVYDDEGNDTGKTTRALVRHNTLVEVDEGTKLLHLQERSGSTLTDTIKSAYFGVTIGERNASAERTRVVPAGSYVLGLLVGLQTDLSGPLFTDANEADGTPERFLFASARDGRSPEVRPSFPGPLQLHRPEPAALADAPTQLDDDGYRRIVLRMPQSFADAVDEAERRKHLQYETRTRDDDAGNHEAVVTMKTAGLLALLDNRLQPTEEDVALAAVVVDTSGRVQEHCKRLVRQLEDEIAERRTVAAVRRAKRTTTATKRADEAESLKTAVGQFSRKVRRLSNDGEVPTRRACWRAVNSVHTRVVSLDSVVDEAVAQGFVVELDDGTLAPGPTVPPTRN